MRVTISRTFTWSPFQINIEWNSLKKNMSVSWSCRLNDMSKMCPLITQSVQAFLLSIPTKKKARYIPFVGSLCKWNHTKGRKRLVESKKSCSPLIIISVICVLYNERSNLGIILISLETSWLDKPCSI